MEVVDIVHTALWDSLITEEVTYQELGLILKGGGDFWGVGIVEVMWKTIALILNRRLGVTISLYDVFYDFQDVRGKGITFIEAKLI